MLREIYLDNSATTRCFDEVIDFMSLVQREAYGNPSSMHSAGIKAENYLRYAKEVFAKILKVSEKEILFTSGGTESDNLSLIGCAQALKRSGNHLITTKIEHPAILETMKYLETQGFKVTYLDVNKNGWVEEEELKKSLREDTILVSIMQVNNEIGSLMHIKEYGEIIKAYNPRILFHVDAVQSFGKVRIHPKKLKVDLLSISGHKIHGPKGVGVLYVGDNVKINPIIFGGGQQRGLRSGTENVPAIAGIAKATECIYTDFEEKINNLYDLKEYFVSRLLELEDVSINGIPDTLDSLKENVRLSAPHVVSASFKGIRAEVLLHALEAEGIYVSSGSACASNKPATSATLLAIGLDKSLLDSTIRFSFSVHTTKDELDTAIEVLQKQLPMLRRFTRR